jgi:limonene-1,2-epoxide hydrolase
MTGTTLIKFTDTEDKESGVRQMFGFAADDYEAKTGRKATTATGTILEADDTMEKIDGFVQLCIKGDYDLIIFDINNVDDDKVALIRDYFKKDDIKYDEVENVYEDRIVFGKTVNNDNE